MDFQATQKTLEDLLAKLNINGTVELDTHFDEYELRVVAKNLNPRQRKQLIEALEAFPQVELDHEFTPSLCQKAYDILRLQNPSHYVDLDPNFAKISYHETTSFGRRVVELIQELLTGNSQYSNYIWKKEDGLEFEDSKITIEEANALIKRADKVPLLLLDDTRVLDYKPNESITIETDGYITAHNEKSGEIYGHFHADFTITANNEVSVELCCEDGSQIRSSGIQVIIPKENGQESTETDNLDVYLSDESIKLLSPTEDLSQIFVTLFKKQQFAWTFEELVRQYGV